MLIARLTAQLRCYIPEPLDETWGRLRHLGGQAAVPLKDLASRWLAGVSVVLARTGGDPVRLRRLGLARRSGRRTCPSGYL